MTSGLQLSAPGKEAHPQKKNVTIHFDHWPLLDEKASRTLNVVLWVVFGVGLILFPLLWVAWCVFSPWALGNKYLTVSFTAIRLGAIIYIVIVSVVGILSLVFAFIMTNDYTK